MKDVSFNYMPEPASPPNVQGRFLPIGSISKFLTPPTNPRVQDASGVERTFNYLPPLAIGQYVEFPFPIDTDTWIDPVTGLIYFKQCGKTIGSRSSNADYSDDRWEKLFIILYGNPNLELLNSNNNSITKIDAQQDWLNNMQLRLPYAKSNKVIYTGCLNA